MPDDVPLEGPPRRLTPRMARGDAWVVLPGWEFLFLVALSVTVTFVVWDGGPTSSKAAAVLLLMACAIAYLLFGRRAIRADRSATREGLLYLGIAFATFVPATVIVPSSSFALFGLCPQMFMLLRSGWALVAVVGLNLCPAIRFLLQPGVTRHELAGFVTTSAIAITFSLVFGPWVLRIIDQSAERAELIEELRASRAEVERLSRERGALAERQRLAGEIHDTLAQGFTSIIMLIQAAEAQADPSRHLALAVRTARENLEEARGLIAALTPGPLDGSTLEEALGRIAARLGEELGAPVTFTAEGASRPIAPGLEVVLIRAAQEALANVRKHAAASSAQVTLQYGEREVVLRVRDDGTGFDGAALDAAPAHLADATEGRGYGLRAMRSRVEQAGGTLRVRTAPGEGAELTVRLPHEPENPQEPEEESPA
ncbi:two-component sensor histidine kinase [Sphaerisporangium siamense]|uniref:Oxygen sensor histidine kinase NreB n=1 Tax=Sphaerisporangium siamense TaxID=795645 RepID=A0A7W7DF35_9ACTN|nr:sensor histidine kinase [Sphaerisporangium siamense]MBB4705642.1 signal transduction histidine kinase [Sphaerisporangium siamense]GII82974.1 two-component sensor histidine kinase [Sphaerisporangium siamense]